RLAKSLGCKVTLVTVIQPHYFPGEVNLAMPPEVEQTVERYARGLLRREATQAHTEGVETDTLVLRGAAANELLKASEATDVEMVVLGNEGRGAIGRAVMGSVSARLLHLCKRPVVVVR